MIYLLEKYRPSGALEEGVEPIFREIVNGDHLWAKEYPSATASVVHDKKQVTGNS